MKVVLIQDVEPLGYEGQVVNVKKGYARNYLIPQRMGLEATPQNIRSLEARLRKIELTQIKAKEQAEKIKDALEQVVLSFAQRVGEEGKLYGSVTSMDIAQGLEQKGMEIDRKKIVLDKPIKTLGEFEVPIRIYREVTAKIKVVVEAASEEGAS